MEPISRFRTISDLPRRIPVFPLRGVILLPRAELPLNIFEPRYLAMVDDSIAGNRVIGIIQPENNADGAESPPGRASALKHVGCAGRVTAFQELQDGRVQITLTGLARFTTDSEPSTEKPFRIAEVSYQNFSADLEPDTSAKAIDRGSFLRILKSYLEKRRLEADWTAIARAPLEPLVNGLSAMSPFGPEEKQALLEATDVKSRADVLIALAEMVIASSGNSGTTLQ